MALKATYLPVTPPLQPLFYNSIPARDLDDDDWAGLTEDQQTLIESSPLYQMEA